MKGNTEYKKTTNIQVDVLKAKNFNGLKEFETDGQQDIGPYNGPLGLDEFEKAMHLLVIAVSLAEPLDPPPAEPVHYREYFDLS